MQATQPVVEMVFRKLGGREVLGQMVTSEAADLARLVHGRIPLRALIYVRRGGFSDQEIGRYIRSETFPIVVFAIAQSMSGERTSQAEKANSVVVSP